MGLDNFVNEDDFQFPFAKPVEVVDLCRLREPIGLLPQQIVQRFNDQPPILGSSVATQLVMSGFTGSSGLKSA